MPELPEVETVRRSLLLKLLDGGPTVLERVDVRRPDLRHPIPEAALAKLAGSRLLAVERRGKVLLLRFDVAETLLVHLGMSGRISVDPGEPDFEKHEHLRFHFRRARKRRVMRYVDPRRFGSVEHALTAAAAAHPRIAELGPEPLDPEAFTGALLFARARKRKLWIRDLLLNGSIVAGVGNIYANEALFRAGIRPQRRAANLSHKDCESIVAELRHVLSAAIEAGGSTLKDGGYVDVEGRAGWFQLSHAVYGRDGEACAVCATIVKRVPKANRAAFYCAMCQR